MPAKLGALIALTCGLVCGCASNHRSFPMSTAPRAYGARGEVATAINGAGNTRVRVKVQHLGAACSVAQDAEHFTVWARSDEGGPPVSLGTLKLDKEQNGTLNAVTPFRRFELLITPEPEAGRDVPRHAPVLRGHVDAI